MDIDKINRLIVEMLSLTDEERKEFEKILSDLIKSHE